MTQALKTFSFSRFSVALFCGLFLFCNAQAASKHTGESLDHIVAVVNDTPITESNLDSAIDTAKKQMEGSNTPIPPAAELRSKVLDQTINRMLQLQIAEQAGIHESDADIDKAIKGIAESNHISAKELLEKVSSQGMSISEYKKEIRDEMIIQQIEQAEVGAHITITPQEIEDFMKTPTWQTYNGKEYHLEDILITLPETPSAQDKATAKKRADEVLAKLHHGTSFEEAATEDGGSTGAIQGGDLGWRELPQVPSAFSSQLIHMKTGDIMGPIATPNGFHIVKLAGVRNADKHETAADQRKKIEQLIFQRKMEEGVKTWIARVRGAAFINMHPEQ